MNYYFKQGLIFSLFFFLMIPFGTAQLYVKGLLHIQDDAGLHVQDAVVIQTADGVVENNGILAIEGNLEKADAATLNTNPNGQGIRAVFMTGTTTQRIDGNFTGSQSFYNLQVDKAQGMVELNNDIEVSNHLNIISGKIRTDISSGTQSTDYQHEVFVNNTASTALESTNTSNSYIEGNLRRAVSGMATYSFPVGLNEKESFTINFTSPANSTEVSAAFEPGIVTATGITASCDNVEEVMINCVLGQWNVQGNGLEDAYNINFSPSAGLQENCPDAGTFFVAKDGQINCPADMDISNGISSEGFTGFGIFDIPTAATGGNTTACGLATPIATYLGNRQSRIDWEEVSNATMYRIQIRFKGMDRWLATALIRASKVFVFAPSNRDYEYRIQTICEDGESEYTQVFEWSTSDNGLVVAESRNVTNFKADIIINNEEAPTFEAFPNPVSDRLQVAYTPDSDNAQLQIHHVSGKTVFEQPLIKGQSYHRINLQSLSEGIYLLTIKEKGKPMQSQRVIKSSYK